MENNNIMKISNLARFLSQNLPLRYQNTLKIPFHISERHILTILLPQINQKLRKRNFFKQLLRLITYGIKRKCVLFKS